MKLLSIKEIKQVSGANQAVIEIEFNIDPQRLSFSELQAIGTYMSDMRENINRHIGEELRMQRSESGPYFQDVIIKASLNYSVKQ